MTLTTNFSRPRLGVCELIAACPTFRQVVGATTSAQAVAHVYSPYADDVLEPSGDFDAAGEPIMRLTSPRPRALVNHEGMDRQKLGTAYGGGTGQLILDLEFPPAEGVTDPNQRLADFEELVGKILDELEARIGQDKGADEGVYTGQAVSFVNLTRWMLVAGPGEMIAKEEQGDVFLAVTLIVEFTG